jgi:hypothetical protein
MRLDKFLSEMAEFSADLLKGPSSREALAVDP